MADGAIQWESPEDVIMVSNSLNDYPDFACWRRMMFSCDFEYQFYDIIDGLDAVKAHRLDRRLVMEISRSGGIEGTGLRTLYLLLPLAFYRRSDKQWIMQRGSPQLRCVVYGPANTRNDEPAKWDQTAHQIYKRMVGKLTEIMETEDMRMEGPKDAQRTRREALEILHHAMPMDVAISVLEMAYGT